MVNIIGITQDTTVIRSRMDDMILNPDKYDPNPLPRNSEEKICPHCDHFGDPTNRYLYRCENPECGRYF